jgi:uncharacterized membrane protein
LASEAIEKIEKPSVKNSLNKQKDFAVEQFDQKEAITQNNTLEKRQVENLKLPDEALSHDELILKNKVDEVIAQVKQLQDDQGTVTSQEIDVLLARAQRQIQTQRILSSEKVDPEALLGDVESELERSFRDRVFNALGNGFEYIRTAVVERNN